MINLIEILQGDLEVFEQIRLRIELEIKDLGDLAVFPCRALLGSIQDRIYVLRAALAALEAK
jgi:hypothetical protein